jgi:hypothetical protein
MLNTSSAGAKKKKTVKKYLDDTDLEGWELRVPIDIFMNVTSLRFITNSSCHLIDL